MFTSNLRNLNAFLGESLYLDGNIRHLSMRNTQSTFVAPIVLMACGDSPLFLKAVPPDSETPCLVGRIRLPSTISVDAMG